MSNNRFGIGTIAPTANLQVDGDAVFNTNVAIGVSSATTNRLLVQSGSTAFVINQNGNVGIGVLNPTSSLQVGGTISATTINAGTIATGAFSTAGIAASSLSVSGNVRIAGNLSILSDVTINGNLTLKGNVTTDMNSEKMDITNSGTGPAFRVNQIGSEPVIVVQRNTSNVLVVNSNGDSIVTGNVGIGTTNPTAKLDIITPSLTSSFDKTAVGTLNIRGPSVSTDNNTGYISLGQAITFQADTYPRYSGNFTETVSAIRSSYDTSGADTVSGGHALSFWTYNGWNPSGSLNERMRISSDGNVGIGTSSVAAPLHLYGTSGSSMRIDAAYGSLGSSYLQLSGGLGDISMANNFRLKTTRTSQYGNGANFQIIPCARDTELSAAVTILHGGNVGIGTTVPLAPLHLLSSTGDFIHQMFGNSAGNGCDVDVRRGRGTVDAPLGVLENDVLYGLYTKSYVSTATNGSAASGYCGAIKIIADENHSALSQGSRIEFDTTANGSTTRSVRMIIKNDGNVGIGTTAPTEKLQVSDTIYSSKGLLPSGSWSSVATTDSKFLFYKYSANNWSGMGVDTGGKWWLKTGTNDQNFNLITMNGSNGNVGIGTAAPTSKLDVRGIARADYYKFSPSWVQRGQDIYGEAALDLFGRSVCLNGNGLVVVVGAPINSSNAGHVRVYDWTGTAWVQRGADMNGEAAADESGTAVSINSIGDIVAIGSPKNDGVNGVDSGSVRVYKWNTGTLQWDKLGQDIDGEAAADNFGASVSLNDAGTVLAVGADLNDGTNGINSGSVRVYTWNAGTSSWDKRGQDIDGEVTEDRSGISVSLDSTGDTVAIGAWANDAVPASNDRYGQVRIYTWNAGTSLWDKRGQDIDGTSNLEEAGRSVSLNGNGTVVAVPGDKYSSDRGRVRVFEWNAGTSLWVQRGQDIIGEAASDRFGYSVSLNDAGNILAASAIYNDGTSGTDRGHVRVYSWDGNSWVQIGTDIDGSVAGDNSGISISLNSAGDLLAIGGYKNDIAGTDAGQVRVFRLTNSQITPVDKGLAVANDGENVGIGTIAPTDKLDVRGSIVVSEGVLDRGVYWTSRTSAADYNWNSVAYGNGLFVAVASGTGPGTNKVMTSPGGISWTIRTAAADNDWNSVAFGNGLFVAVASSGTGNRVMTSPDGISWTSRSSAANNSWNGVTYGNGLFVAVASSGTGNRVMTSPDGITWTLQDTTSLDRDWNSVAYGNGVFVAVASGSGAGIRVMKSSNGLAWSSSTVPEENAWLRVTYGAGKFVAVSYTGGYRVMTSPDGESWTSRTAAANLNWSGIAYGNSLFVAVANSGLGNRVMTSPDGETWTLRASAADNNWRNVTYGNGVFVAVGTSGVGNRVMTSGKTYITDKGSQNLVVGPFSVMGNVGIGTTTATTPLDIYGAPGNVFITGFTSSANLNPAIEFRRGGGTTVVSTAVSAGFVLGGIFGRGYVSTASGVSLAGTNTGAIRFVAAENYTDTAQGTYIDFATTSVGSTTRSIAMVIANDGKVGIGTTAPNDFLDVNGGTGSSVSIRTSITNGTRRPYARLYVNDDVSGSGSWGLQQGWNTLGSQPFVILSGSSTEMMRINTSGNVGIGTTAPTAKLDVAGNIMTSGSLIVPSAQGILATTGSDSATVMSFDFPNVATTECFARFFRNTNTTGSKTVRFYKGNGSTSTSALIGVDGTDSFFQSDGGNVGIGTTAPTAKLNVLGSTVVSEVESDRGIYWTTNVTNINNIWNSVAYGAGVFIAVASSGTGNRVMASYDGTYWTTRTSAADYTWNSVAYGNYLFVAVASSGTGNRVMTSDDGFTWTSRTSAADNSWASVAYGNGTWVAVSVSGIGNRVMTSLDGITWTSRSSAADNDWRSVAYGNGTWVAVSTSGTNNRVMTSPDGITWTSRSSAADNDWRSVTYGNGLFVAVSSTGIGNRVMTSPDGITWTSRSSAANNNWYGVTYGNGLFVAVASTGTNNRVMTSSDGFTWTTRTTKSTTDQAWQSITFGNGTFVSTSATSAGNRVLVTATQGYIGIGTNIPTAPLHVTVSSISDTGTFMPQPQPALKLMWNEVTDLGEGEGTKISFSRTIQGTTDSDYEQAYIGSYKVNGTDAETGSSLVFGTRDTTDSGTNASERMRLDSGGITLTRFSSTSSTNPAVGFCRGRGTVDVPLGVISGSVLGGIYGQSYISTATVAIASGTNTGAIRFVASENHTLDNQGAYIDFATTKNGTNSRTVRMTIADSGNVGIGTATPTRALLDVASNVTYNMSSGGYYFAFSTSSISSFTGGNTAVSIYGNGYMWASSGFIASSDRRIKTNIIEIDDDVALQTLRQLKPSTYNYIDTVSRTNEQVYGFIAQEVKEVLPYAVTQRQEIIPDIYKVGILTEGGMLKLPEDKLLNINDKLRLLTKTGKEGMGTVTSVIDSQTVTIDINIDDFDLTEPQEVFVYGREVNDFHVLQKEAIFTVGVSAIQELDRQQQIHKTKLQELQMETTYQKMQIEELQNQNSQLKAKLEAVLAHLGLSV